MPDWPVVMPAMPWRIWVFTLLLGMFGGAIFGFVRGLSHVPTLYFAVLEGALLIGAPAALLGLLLVGVWILGGRLRRHSA